MLPQETGKCVNYRVCFIFELPYTAVCRTIKGFAFYSSKRPILRVIGGAEGVVPHPHNGGSK